MACTCCPECQGKAGLNGLGGLSSLPSSDAAARFVMGEEGAFGGVVSSTLLRALLIAAGMYVAGIRDEKTLVKAALGGAIGIEVFVLFYVWQNAERLKALQAAATPT